MRCVIEGMYGIFFYYALQCMYDTTDAVFNIKRIIKTRIDNLYVYLYYCILIL